MRISFDLDDTLIIPNSTKVEPLNLLGRMMGIERLRFGTKALIAKLLFKGHEVWIYTSSERGVISIKTTFLFHGLKLNGVVNGNRHREESEKENSYSSKNPKLFDIDLHVDDSIGVSIEAGILNYQVLCVEPNDDQWTNKVLRKVEYIESKVDEHFKDFMFKLLHLQPFKYNLRDYYIEEISDQKDHIGSVKKLIKDYGILFEKHQVLDEAQIQLILKTLSKPVVTEKLIDELLEFLELSDYYLEIVNWTHWGGDEVNETTESSELLLKKKNGQ